MSDDESQDIRSLEAKVLQLVSEAHRHIQERNEAEAVRALDEAGAAAQGLVVARIESDAPPSELSPTDHAVWSWAQQATTEYQLGNNQLGDWYREGARRRALERWIVEVSGI